MLRLLTLSLPQYMNATGDLYAAGDIAKFPLPLIDSSVSIGHWQLAHYHGRIAAQNMMGKEVKFNSIPYFWTVLCGKSLRYCGQWPFFQIFPASLVNLLFS